MSTLRQLAGPELYWVIVYVIATLFARQNVPPTEAGSRFLEKLAWLVPLIAVPASFFLYALPDRSRWLTTRLLLAAIIGVNVVSIKLINGIDYQDGRNAGVMGVWALGILAGIVGLVVGFAGRWIIK